MVGAQLEPDDAVLLVAQRRKQDDRRPTPCTRRRQAVSPSSPGIITSRMTRSTPPRASTRSISTTPDAVVTR